MEALKAKIEQLGLSRTELEALLKRHGAPKPVRTDPLDWSPTDIEAYLNQWSQTLECKKRLSGQLHPFHTNPSAYLTEKQICQKIGLKCFSGWKGFVQNRGMPKPDKCTHYLGNYSYNEHVWDKAAWHDWYTQKGTDSAAEGRTRPTLQMLKSNPRALYATVSNEWIHELARKKGRHLTHTLTISFTSVYGRDDDLNAITKINEQEREQVGKLAKKLPIKVWRKFENAITTPKDKFCFCVWPESFSKHGSPARWHFHVELFLTDQEARFLQKHVGTIEVALKEHLFDFANGRQINIKFDEVDAGYSAYSSKNAISSIDMIEHNFFEPKA